MTLVYSPSISLPACGPTIPLSFSFGIMGGSLYAFPSPPSIRQLLTPAIASLRELGAISAPIVPLLRLIAVARSITDLISHLPGSVFTAQIVTDVQNVAAAVLAAVSIFDPVTATLAMAKGFVGVYLNFLRAMKTEITSLIARYTNVNALIAQAISLGNEAMRINAQCAKNNLDSRVAAMNQTISGLGAAILVFSYILCLATGGELPAIPTLDAGALSDTVFDPLIMALQDIYDGIPTPSSIPLDC